MQKSYRLWGNSPLHHRRAPKAGLAELCVVACTPNPGSGARRVRAVRPPARRVEGFRSAAPTDE
ncbi:hypothetical protein GCM10022288_13450 [Gryllotalpicola kribbensis]|uniref:Uncharacterized protein n=1 Tax=Gryllotalpicola kribbensis TaxID=993084 RepID=A0ABP8AR27_9MICO